MANTDPPPSGRKINLSQLNHDEIQRITTQMCKDAYCSNHWKAKILLPLYPFEGWKTTPDPSTILPTEQDLCSFLDGNNGDFQLVIFC
jgi:hypothetical protein